MKNHKNLLLTAVMFGLVSTAFSQTLENKDTFTMDTLTIHVGDDLTIGKPSTFDFVNVVESKHGLGIGNIANAAGALGSTVGLLGAETGHLGTAMTGIKVMNAANTAASVGWTADAIAALNVSNQAKKIIGKKFRVLRFKKEGNQRRGEHIYAILAGEGKTNYKAELAPAIKSHEIIAINTQIFNTLEH
ncbi:hypothetical protein SAMN05192529_11773 [Arachidicoccus rhizosphaerae]|uniref:Uncharacterized protein n=1 Tax=Arachidicoccus rhizosphaerae TaxID=551991 RepID=A0A1H4B0I9_9BACT|nr:hypothetical protein [Arachidicoccus rhizosphaerae]SEA41558.1 hypothetical protein SAMN05192529_11773 [Arachidicoccus rhizosphaerae]